MAKKARKSKPDRRPTAAEQRLLERLTDWTADTVIMAKEFPVPDVVRRHPAPGLSLKPRGNVYDQMQESWRRQAESSRPRHSGRPRRTR